MMKPMRQCDQWSILMLTTTFALTLVPAGLVPGCDDSPPEDVSRTPSSSTTSERRPARIEWGDGYVVVRDAELLAALEKATTEARASAAEARLRWLEAAPHEKDRWMIKWAAPTDDDADDTVEFIWVRPERWSPFRIEGRLLAQPTHELGVSQGDLVGFPIEQLADWVHLLDGTIEGPRQGGFTMDVLERSRNTPAP